ncbi:MAG: AbrB/MazE/SpoVT family DNA-binding domain-containing protein [Candidatus Diapherotrites archaeon]
MKCPKRSAFMQEGTDRTPEGFSYRYHKCISCGEEIVDMKQLHEVAQKYRTVKQYTAKISKWGESMAIRIPKPLAKEMGLKEKKNVSLVREKDSIRIIAQ